MNTPPPLPELLPTASPCWQRAFGGIWRLTSRRFVAPQQLGLLAGLLGLLALLALSGIRNGNVGHFAQWSEGFYLTFVVPIVAFLSGAGLIQDDMKPATTDYMLTRPVRRHVFVFHRYLAQNICLQIQCLLALCVLVAVGMFRQVPDLAAIVPSLLLAQVLAVTAFSALGFGFGAFTSRYLILGLFYAGVIELGIGNIPTQLNRLSMTHQVRSIASSSLAQFNRLPSSISALLVFSLVFVTAAAALFAWRETTGAKPKDA